jgi:hypothetical protein
MNFLDLVFTTNVYWDVLKNKLNFFGKYDIPPLKHGHATMLHCWFCQKNFIKDTSYVILFHSSLQVFIILLPMIMVFFMDLNFTLNYFLIQ